MAVRRVYGTYGDIRRGNGTSGEQMYLGRTLHPVISDLYRRELRDVDLKLVQQSHILVKCRSSLPFQAPRLFSRLNCRSTAAPAASRYLRGRRMSVAPRLFSRLKCRSTVAPAASRCFRGHVAPRLFSLKRRS